MTYDFDKIIDRRGTHAVKVDRIKEGQIPLWIADMDFECAKPIVDALSKRVEHGIFGYTTYDEDLKQTVQKWFEEKYKVHYETEWMEYAPCVVTALSFLIEAFTEPGDSILIQEPVYFPFKRHIISTGRKPVIFELSNNYGFYSIDFMEFEKKIADPNVKGMILCSPHNPGGRVWSRSELRIMVDIAKAYDKFIICDEIHCDIRRAGVEFTPLLAMAEDYKDKIAICTSASKSFNLAGMQICTSIIPNKEIREKYEAISQGKYDISNPSALSIVAYKAAYEEGSEWLEQVNKYIDSNLEYAIGFIYEHFPRAIVSPPEGSYLLWVDLDPYMKDKREETVDFFAEKVEPIWENVADLIDKTGVMVNDGQSFGECAKNYIRINAACPRSVLEEGLNRLVSK